MWDSRHFTSLRSTRWTVSSLCLVVALAAFAVAGCDSVVHTTAPDLLAPEAEALFAQTKVDVCHRNQDGVFVKITIANAAYGTHLEHGDQTVGSGGLDAECQPLPCPCFTAESLVENLASAEELVLTDFEDGENWLTRLFEDIGLISDGFWAEYRDGGYSCAAEWEPAITHISQIEGESCRQLLLDYEL